MTISPFTPSGDRVPSCTLVPGTLSTCICTDRPGCQSGDEDVCCAHCGQPECEGDCEPDLQETYPGSGVYE